MSNIHSLLYTVKGTFLLLPLRLLPGSYFSPHMTGVVKLMACMLHPPHSQWRPQHYHRCRPLRGSSLELSGQPQLLTTASSSSHALLQEIIQLALAQAAEQS